MKRVYCLYRVSTAQQVDVVKDDIPMQRIACHDFAARMGWTILVEKEEKGISGFKVSAEKRDAIQVENHVKFKSGSCYRKCLLTGNGELVESVESMALCTVCSSWLRVE